MNIPRLVRSVDKEIAQQESDILASYKMRWFLALLPSEITSKLPDAFVQRSILTFDDLTADEVETVVKLIPGEWRYSFCPTDDDRYSYHLYLAGITIRVWRGDKITFEGMKEE